MQLVLFSPAQPEPPRPGVRVHNWVFDLPALASWWQSESYRAAPVPLPPMPPAYPAPIPGLPVSLEAYRDLLAFVRSGPAALQGAALLLSHALPFARQPAPGAHSPQIQHAPLAMGRAVYDASAVRLHSLLPIDLVDLTTLEPLPGPDAPRLAVALVAGQGAGVHALFGYSLLAVARGESGPRAILGPALLTRDEVPDPSGLTVDITRPDGSYEHHKPFTAVAPWDLLPNEGAPLAPGRIVAVPLPAPAASLGPGDAITFSAPGLGALAVLGHVKGIASPTVEAVDVCGYPTGSPNVPRAGRRLASVAVSGTGLWQWLSRTLWGRNRPRGC